MDTSRLILAVVLSLGLIFLYQEVVLKRIAPPPPHQLVQQTASALPSAGASPGTTVSGTAAQPVVGTASAATALQPASPAGPERLITIETDQYVAQVTTRGGRIKSFMLKHYNETASPKSGWYELVPQTGDFVLPLGAIVSRGDQVLNDAALDYTTSAPDKTTLAADEGAKVVLDAHTADGAGIEKTLNFHGDTYAFTTDLAITGGPKNDAIGLALSQPLNPHAGYYDIPELQADVTGKTMNEAEKALRKGVAPVTGTITYAGFGDRYFLTAYLPAAPSAGTLVMTFVGASTRR